MCVCMCVICRYVSMSLLPDSLEWQELLISMGSLEYSGGRAEIAEVTRCSGDVSALIFFLCLKLLAI